MLLGTGTVSCDFALSVSVFSQHNCAGRETSLFVTELITNALFSCLSFNVFQNLGKEGIKGEEKILHLIPKRDDVISEYETFLGT